MNPNGEFVLIILFKSNQSEKISIPSNLSSLGQIDHYRSIVSTDDEEWSDAFISEMKNKEEFLQLDRKGIIETLKREFNAENIFIGSMIYSIDCIKDKSNDVDNDVFFGVAFTVKERIEQFPEDWFKATPYMSSCDGFKRATVYKVIDDNPRYPYINLAIWSSLDSWKKAISTEESRKAHSHQDHVQRTPFIAKYVHQLIN